MSNEQILRQILDGGKRAAINAGITTGIQRFDAALAALDRIASARADAFEECAKIAEAMNVELLQAEAVAPNQSFRNSLVMVAAAIRAREKA